MPTRNIQLTDELDRFIVGRIENGRYENAHEVIAAALRVLEREEREFDVRLKKVRASIDEGDSSGIAEGNVFSRLRAALKPVPSEGQ